MPETDANAAAANLRYDRRFNLFPFAHVFRKFLIENIRVSLFCPDKSQLLYTQSYYEFRMESNRLTPSNIGDMCDDSTHFDHISFEDDWTSRKVWHAFYRHGNCLFLISIVCFVGLTLQNGVLYPDTAAIIVLKTNLTHFNETINFHLDAIVLYRVVDETGKSMELQLHAGRIELDTDVLYDRYYAIQFDKDHGE